MEASLKAIDPSELTKPNYKEKQSAEKIAEVTRRLNAVRDEENKNNDIIQKMKNPKKHWIYNIYGTQMGLALCSGTLVVLLLYLINPPLTQKPRMDNITQEKQCWKKTLFVFCIVVFLVFILPDLLVLFHLFERN